MNTWKKLAATAAAMAVTAVSVVSASMTASAEGKSEGPYMAWIAASIGTNQQWSADTWESTNATIDKEGTYTISAVVPENGGSETIEFLSLETDINVYAFVAEGGDYKTEGTLKLAVDRIWVSHLDGTETDITYNGPGELAYCTRDDGSSARLNILNEWGGAVQMTTDIDKNIPGGIGAGESINIQFTVSGINAGGGTATTDESSDDGTQDNAAATTTPTNPDGTPATTTTTTAAAGSNNNNSNKNNNSSNNGSSSNNSNSSGSDTTSETGDFGIAAVVLGAVATLALGAGAVTVTRRKK